MTRGDIRTIVKYPGAKWREAPWIISNMPNHDSYLEPYFGSGAIFFLKEPSHIETVNDIDGDVVNLYRVVRERADELARAVWMTPYARQEYYSAFKPADEPVERARRFLLKMWQGHASSVRVGGWRNDVAGRERAYAVRSWNGLPNRITQVLDRLKDAQIECSPAVDLIQRFNRPNVLIYCDPPYLLSTRGQRRRYAYEMSDADHAGLLEALLKHQGAVMLSGYDSDLYNRMLSGWTKLQKETTAEKGEHRIETLWVNYDLQLRLE